MMASAMLRAGAVLADEWATGHALLTLQRSDRRTQSPDAVAHTPGGLTGLLDDQVQASAAPHSMPTRQPAIANGSTGPLQFMGWVWSDYWDREEGGLFDTASGRSDQAGLLPARAKPVQDTPTPSPNGVAGVVAATSACAYRPPEWQERARQFSPRLPAEPLSWDCMRPAISCGRLAPQPGNPSGRGWRPPRPSVQNMHRAALAGFVPRRVVQLLPLTRPPVKVSHRTPGHAGRRKYPRGYACTGTSCAPPAGDPSAWQVTLESLRAALTA